MKKLLDKAVNFIVETQIENDYICEENGEWCANHCIDHLRKECVIHYLNNIYKENNEE